MSLELCFICGEATGRAGAGEDSIYDDDGKGPYCERCWESEQPLVDGDLATQRAIHDSCKEKPEDVAGRETLNANYWKAKYEALVSASGEPDYKKLYHELLYAVGKKYPGETRHHTALRYILNAERGDGIAKVDRTTKP